MNKRILVTGANGFVGRALVDALGLAGAHVISVSRSPLNETPQGAVTLIQGCDLTREDYVLPLSGVDVILHLAGLAHVLGGGKGDSVAHFKAVNEDATRRLAERAAAAGVRRFVFLSSIGVHGRCSDSHPFSEQSAIDPVTEYARSKAHAETALWSVARTSGLELTIVRPPLVYGPGAKGNFPRLLGLLRRGVPLPFGRIKNRRSFISLANLVDFLCLCADTEKSPAAADQVFDVADGDVFSTSDFMKALCVSYGYPDRIFSFPVTVLTLLLRVLGRQAMIDQLISSLEIDISKARDLLGWRPVAGLKDQLERGSIHDQAA